MDDKSEQQSAIGPRQMIPPTSIGPFHRGIAMTAPATNRKRGTLENRPTSDAPRARAWRSRGSWTNHQLRAPMQTSPLDLSGELLLTLVRVLPVDRTFAA
jgi:hypothetical protein